MSLSGASFFDWRHPPRKRCRAWGRGRVENKRQESRRRDESVPGGSCSVTVRNPTTQYCCCCCCCCLSRGERESYKVGAINRTTTRSSKAWKEERLQGCDKNYPTLLNWTQSRSLGDGLCGPADRVLTPLHPMASAFGACPWGVLGPDFTSCTLRRLTARCSWKENE